MIPVTTPYVVKLLNKIDELEFVIHNMRQRDADKDTEIYNLRRGYNKEVQKLKKTIKTYEASLKFVVLARKIIEIQRCPFIDRIDFDDAEIVLPHVRLKDNFTTNRDRSIFYMWLRGYTYRDIAIAVKLSGERIRQIIRRIARIYRIQREGILKSLSIRAEMSLITNDYRNNREEIINQIKGIYDG